MPLVENLYEGVFWVTQLTRGTPLERIVGVDRVRMKPYQVSIPHYHPQAETVLYIEEGFALVIVNGISSHIMGRGDQLFIAKGDCHYIRTSYAPLRFISVQMPPIHDEATGRHDVEVCDYPHHTHQHA